MEDDPTTPPTTGDDALDALLAHYWPSIKDRHRRMRVMDTVNVRMLNDDNGEELLLETDTNAEVLLRQSWRGGESRVKINCSFGMVLEHKTTFELKYFHSSSNNATYEQQPTYILTEQMLMDYLNRIARSDIAGTLTSLRPNTEWKLRAVTNITFFLYKMLGMGKIGSNRRQGVLPIRLTNSKAVRCMDKNPKTGKLYEDNLCFFRCLTVALNCKCGKKKTCVCNYPSRYDVLIKYQEYYKRVKSAGLDARHFKGVDCEDLLRMEDIFNVKIVVFELVDKEGSNVVWTSSTPKKERKMLNLNLHGLHFSLIVNMDRYAKAYGCPTCTATYTRSNHLLRHTCLPDQASNITFPGGAFKATQTIFDLVLEKTGIDIGSRFPDLRFYPYRATYDIECYFPKDAPLPSRTETMEFLAVHDLLSVSVSSNVPGFTSPKCFVRKTTVDECVTQFVEYLLIISREAERCERLRWKNALALLDNAIRKRKKVEEEFAGEKFSTERIKHTRQDLEGIVERVDTYLRRMPVVGFNSQRYDMNVLKGPLLRLLDEKDDICLTIKRNSSMPCVETGSLRFLDICNYLAPNYTYDKYLKAFNCSQKKGFFPYEWMDNLKKLDETELPPASAFHSSLQGTTISDADYSFCKHAWLLEGMKTFEDYLVWYNNLDVQPFLEALEKQSSIFRLKGIDMLKDAISLPGLAVLWMFAITGEDKIDEEEVDGTCNSRFTRQPAMLLDKSCEDLYNIFRQNLTGGPSIIFHRYHERGVTRLRELEFKNESKLCDRILGVDANALYLWCTMQSLPTGVPIRRSLENDFLPTKPAAKHGKTAIGWLSWVELETNRRICHAMNGGEKHLGEHGLPVDGFCPRDSTAYQFHGCYWHAHDCPKTKGLTMHPSRKISMAAVRAESDKKDSYIRSLGYDLTVMRECEWERIVNANPRIKGFLFKTFSFLYGARRPSNMDNILAAVKDGKFFGYVECDIETPVELENKFSEMAPIFKNVDVSQADLGDHMRFYAEQNGYLKHPQRMLVGSLHGKKVFLFSDLLRWYLSHGLVVTKIHQTYEYKPRECYASFGKSVSEARREGDLDPSKALLADTSKLVGNSFYGKTITNKEKHRTVVYVKGITEASVRIRNVKFISLEEIDKDFYEIVLHKKKIKMDVPVSIGFTILQLAKLRMLQFYYDLMDKYVDRKDFQYVEMDTDSAYMALSDTLHNVIKPNLLKSFYEEYGNWFPKPFCKNHEKDFVSCKIQSKPWILNPCCAKVLAFERRTPGLFKDEFCGDGMIALNSKTYVCWNDMESKISSKGLNKSNNSLRKEQYKSVLFAGRSFYGVNRGFVFKKARMYTYKQRKKGLSYFYAKRQVLNDGITTINTRL